MMIKDEVARVSRELEVAGHALTTFEMLGIDRFGALASELFAAVEQNAQLQPERATSRIGMVMCKDDQCKAAGAALVKPVIETLFAGNATALENWVPYTVNQYLEGDFFSPHQDYLDGTVVIVTASGVRNLDVYKKEDEDDLFKEVEASYSLRQGSVMLLDGYKDLGHAAKCVEGPSVSVVGDVSERIRI